MSDQKSSSRSNKRFSDSNMAIMKKSDVKQKDFRAFVDSQNRFSNSEKSMLKVDSFAKFESLWNTTVSAKDGLEVSREHGAKRVGQSVQNFAASAYDVLEDMEPLLDVVMDFGSPYGGMAIGTIAFLLAVAKNRASIEAKLSATLLQIRDRIFGLKLYKHIYNDDHELDQQLQFKIVQTYDSFIEFCIAATTYYSMGGFKRYLISLSGSSDIRDRASEVQKAILDVKQMSTELLEKNIDTIKQINIDQSQEIRGLKEQIKKLQDGQTGDRMNKIQQLLDLNHYSRESELKLLKKYQSDLNTEFDLNWIFLERMHGKRLEAFKSETKFQEWRDSIHSRMLILAGYNNDSKYSSRHCWVSPVALDIIESLRDSEQSNPYAFYVAGLRESETFTQILSSVILQLLIMNTDALQNEIQYNELMSEIHEYRSSAESKRDYNDKTSTYLQNVAIRILNTFDSTRSVWIILDRVDRCRNHPKSNYRKKILKAMVHLVENSKAKIRVLAVVNGHDWRVDEEIDELGQNRPKSIAIHLARQETAI